MEQPGGPLQRQEEIHHASSNEGYITDHQYKIDNDPRIRCMYGEELQQLHDEDNLLLRFFNINGLKKEIWKEKYIRVMITLKYYNLDIIGLSEVNIHWPLVNPAYSWEEIISGHWETSNLVLNCNLEDVTTKVW